MAKVKVIFDGFDTPEQANAFISWYIGSGEQDSSPWMEEHSDLQFVTGGNRHGDAEKGEMTVQLNLYYKEKKTPEAKGSTPDALQGYGTLENWEKHKGRGFWGNSKSGYISDEDENSK